MRERLHILYDVLGAVMCAVGAGAVAPQLSELCFGSVSVPVQQGVDIFEQLQVFEAHFSVAPSQNTSLMWKRSEAAAGSDSHMGQLMSCFSALAHAF